ncbi:MAG TPA: anthranilate synthase component I, partial [Ktedonobacteraceae bacterium]|nr:anthranilate synthase component I [Ktedonobacteraceae bacterium]
MGYPTLDEVRQLQETEKAVNAHTRKPLLPICRDILADMETPVSAYCKIAPGPFSFLLESVVGGEHIARYSFIGIDPYLVMKLEGNTATLHRLAKSEGCIEKFQCTDPLTFIQAELEQYYLVKPFGIEHDSLPSFHGGAVGYLAYETAARFEHLPVPEKNVLGLPLSVFCFTETVLVFDHLKHRVRIVTHLHLDAPDLQAEYGRVLAILEDIQQRLLQKPQLPVEPGSTYDSEASEITSNRTRGEFETMVCK